MRIHVNAFYGPVEGRAMHTQEPGNLGRLLVLADELAGVCDLVEDIRDDWSRRPSPIRQVGFVLRFPRDEGNEGANPLGDQAIVRVDGVKGDVTGAPLRQDRHEGA